jgi:hypothetical protein
MRVLAFTALAGTLAACGSPKTTMVAGGITTTIGLVALVGSSSSQCDSDFCPFDQQDETNAALLVVTTGVIMTLIGLGQDHDVDKRETAQAQLAAKAPPAPLPVATTTPPSLTPRSLPPVVLKPLPAATLGYTDPSQRQFAFQASAAAMRGDCAAARVAGDRLPIDIEQSLISVDEAYARCLH